MHSSRAETNVTKKDINSSINASIEETKATLDERLIEPLKLNFNSFLKIQRILDLSLPTTKYDLDIFPMPKKTFQNSNPENSKKTNILPDAIWIHMSRYLNTKDLLSFFYCCKQLGSVANSKIIRKKIYNEKERCEKISFDKMFKKTLTAPLNNYAFLDRFGIAPAAHPHVVEHQNNELYNDSGDGKGFIMVNRRS